MEYVQKTVEVMVDNSGWKEAEFEREMLGRKMASMRKAIDRIKVYGEGWIEIVWKAGDVFGSGEKREKEWRSHERVLVALLVLGYNTVQRKAYFILKTTIGYDLVRLWQLM